MEHRIRPLNSIKTDEEYESYKKYLDRNLKEYKLFLNHKEKLAELMTSRAKEYPENSIERMALETRRDLIEKNEYAPLLERNITAYMLTIDEYEAKKENRSLFDVIKGIITRDEDTKDYLKRRYMKSRVEDSGMPIIEPVNLNIETSGAVVRKLFEENNFVNIPKPEMGLIPADTEVNKIFEEVSKMLSECLNENGISVRQKRDDREVNKILTTTEQSNKLKQPKVKNPSKEKDGDERDEI